MKKTRNTIAMAVILMIALLASACNGSGGKTNEPVTIHMLLPFPEFDAPQSKIFKDAAENFHKLHPDITVAFEHIPVEPGERITEQDINDRYDDRLKSKEPLDIIPSREGMTKELMPLSDYANEIDIDENFLDIVKENGVLYELPYSFNVDVLLYNKELFDKAGIPYPNGDWTWDQFEKVSRELNLFDPALIYAPQTIRLLLSSRERDIVSPDGKTYVGYLDSPEAVDAVRWLNRYYQNANQMPGPFESELSAASLSKTPMKIGNYFTYNIIYRIFGSDHNFGVVPLPHFEDGTTATKVDYQGFGIVKTSEHRQEAWQFLKYLFLTSNETMMEMSNYYLSPSESISKANGQLLDPIKSVFVEELAHANGKTSYYPMNPESIELFNSLFSANDDEIGEILHQIALKFDQELARKEIEDEHRLESKSP